MMCGLFAMSFFQLLSVSAAPAPSPEGNAGGVLLSGISYDCGSEATYCPHSFEGSRSEYISGNYYSLIKLEKSQFQLDPVIGLSIGK